MNESLILRFEELFPLEIRDFLSKKDVNYALLLTGKWGSGKTYYCTNVLPQKIGKLGDRFKVIDVSLYGKKTIDSVKADIAFKLFQLDSNDKTKKTNLVGDILQDNLPIVVEGLSNETAKTTLRIFSKVLNKYSSHLAATLKGINVKQDVLIVFDDLERCDESQLFSLLGQINSSFIEQSYHVLFVANEEELVKNYPAFKEKKEKLIRTTYSFSTSLKELLQSIIDRRTETSASSLLFRNKKEEIEKAIDFHLKCIVNLRTWLFAFDLFDSIVQKAKMENNPYLVQLFVILIITIHYKVTNPAIFSSDWMELVENKKDEPSFEKAIQKDFGISYHFFRYGRGWRLDSYKGEFDFFRINTIEEYVDTGLLGTEKFIEEFEEIYPVGTKYELAFVRLSKYARLNDDEFISVLETVFEGIRSNQYSVKHLKSISVMLDDLSIDGYFSLLKKDFDYKEDLKKSISHQIEKEKLGLWELIDDHLTSFEYKSFLDGFPEYLRGIVETSIGKDREEYEKAGFKTIVSQLGHHYQHGIPERYRRKMAERIVGYSLLNSFLSYSFCDIEAFSLYLDSISRAENCGDIPDYYSEIKPLRTIQSYLNNACDANMFFGKKLCDIKRLSKKIENTCKRLETSHTRE